MQTLSVPKLRFKEFRESWQLSRLIDKSDKISDGIHTTPVYDDNGEYYFINGNNLFDGQIRISENTRRIGNEQFNKYKKDLGCNSILLSINGTIGSLAIYRDEKVILGKSACYINVTKSAHTKFVYYLLQNPKTQNLFISELTGSTIKNLSLASVKNCESYYPSFPEQQKIASFLSSVDEKIQQLTRKKELLEQYKKGVMQQIFSGKLRFKDENGKAYPKWEEKRLGDICSFFSGGTPQSTNKKYYSGNIPFIGSGNIYDAEVTTFISQEALENSSAKLVDKGDLLFALYGANSGEVAISKMSGAINQAILCLKTNENINYLYYLLFHNQGRIVSKYLQGGQGNLSAEIVRKLKYKFPSLDEQQKIASFLTALDAKIESVAMQIAHTQTFKKGLLQQMFV